MNTLIKAGFFAMFFVSTSTYAHHPAADIVDEEIYERIDSMVADTPHATMTFDERGGGMTETTVTADSLREFEAMVSSDDLLEYVELLDGVGDVSLRFGDDHSVTMTIRQVR